MKLKKSERKLLEKRRAKLEEAIVWSEEVEAYCSYSMKNFDAKFLLPSARYLSKVVDSLIERRLDFVNRDGSEIGGSVVVEFDAPSPNQEPSIVEGEVVVTEGNLVDGIPLEHQQRFDPVVSEGPIFVTGVTMAVG